VFAGSRQLRLRAQDELRERRESQVTVAQALEQAERMKRIAADLRRMSAIYRERLVGTHERRP
jgi:hypothetical protein